MTNETDKMYTPAVRMVHKFSEKCHRRDTRDCNIEIYCQFAQEEAKRS